MFLVFVLYSLHAKMSVYLILLVHYFSSSLSYKRRGGLHCMKENTRSDKHDEQQVYSVCIKQSHEEPGHVMFWAI